MPVIPRERTNPQLVQSLAKANELKFEFTPAKTMALAMCDNGQWTNVFYPPYGEIPIGPTADRYGQNIFGGLRALRLENGSVALFRPDAHAERFNRNAQRLLMPEIDPLLMVKIYTELVKANMEYMPDYGKGSLYLAPAMRPIKDQIGVKPSTRYALTCVAIPAGKIFSQPTVLCVERKFHRAARGGVGNHKAAGNYAPTFGPKVLAHETGYDDIVFLDQENQFVRELSSSNICFITHDGWLITPHLDGEILDGITRNSILAIADELMNAGTIQVIKEGPVSPNQLKDFREAFSCGTGVTINGVKQIDDGKNQYPMDTSIDGMGPVTRAIAERFNAILAGRETQNPRYKNWLVPVE